MLVGCCTQAVPTKGLGGDEATREIKILFLGNSFTARHDIAGLVEQILEEGDPATDVQVQRVIYGADPITQLL